MKSGMKAVKILGMIVIGIMAVFAFVMATMYLWNWLVPDLFHGPIITFWQALGLLALSKILFSGFGKGGGRGGQCKSHWKSRWQEKWSGMTPEDQERFKEKMKGKWCMPQQEKPVSQAGNSPQ